MDQSPRRHRVRVVDPATGEAKEIAVAGRTLAEAEASLRAHGFIIEGEAPFPESALASPPKPPVGDLCPVPVQLDEATLRRLSRIIGNQIVLGLAVFALALPIVLFVLALLYGWLFLP